MLAVGGASSLVARNSRLVDDVRLRIYVTEAAAFVAEMRRLSLLVAGERRVHDRIAEYELRREPCGIVIGQAATFSFLPTAIYYYSYFF